MKKIFIIGAGLGAGSITEDAKNALAESSVVLGAERLLSEYASFIRGKRCVAKYGAEDVLAAANGAGAETFQGADPAQSANGAGAVAVLVSGDPGFYSAALKICAAFDSKAAGGAEAGSAQSGGVEAGGAQSSGVEAGGAQSGGAEKYCVRVIPGISSLNAMFAALGMPWQDAALCSMHGKDVNAAEYVRRNRITFFLTGKNTAQLSEKLCAAGYEDIKLYVGQDLGSADQSVISCTAKELAEKQLSSLTVIVAENPDADASVRTGIPDEEFIRGSVPMTKSEVRAVLMSKLGIKPDMICADIGAGTGSCTAEMALAAWNGRVYSIDPNPEAVALIKENCRKLHIGNVEAREGLAPDDIKDLPPLDAAFIGGSKGHMTEIFSEILGKNPNCRIVVSSIVLQTLSSALDAFAAFGIEPEVVQIAAAASKRVSGLDMMMARNPIFLISGGGKSSRSEG